MPGNFLTTSSSCAERHKRHGIFSRKWNDSGVSFKKNLQNVAGILFFLSVSLRMESQVLNDECRFALPLPTVEDYCSDDGAFSNIRATSDPEFLNTCVSLRWQNGVWFSFTPRKPGVLIRVFGFGQGGTIQNPKIVVFSGCGEYLQCSPGKTPGNDELMLDNLVVGQVHYIMVESAEGGEGTFKLCVQDFSPVPSPESDCRDGVVLCDKSSFIVESLTGVGSNRNEIEPGNCMDEEFQSAWYKWTCDKPGTLTFTLTPNDYIDENTVSDDLDFSLYELPGGLSDCSNKVLLRCMASGANGDGRGNVLPLAQWAGCNGPTGLMEGDRDLTENPGCQPGNNNFLAPLVMEAGKSYVLIVNNFSRSGLGFQVDFGGTGTFLGPKPDFDINANNAFECDKSVVITDLSEAPTDPIVSYSWNFGDRATPDRGNGTGPFNVTYGSFGNKVAALTVLSSRGCLVTKILEFYVNPCCRDTSTLALNTRITDLKCHEIPEGIIEAVGLRGAPEYNYSLNGGSFRPNPRFDNLSEGSYTLSVQDAKGCEIDIEVIVRQPPPIIVDAGTDQEIELGEATFLNGSFFSQNGHNIQWIPSADFENDSIINPEVFPKDNTTYTLIITDDNGCQSSDQVNIRVRKEYKVHLPNVLKPGSQLNNGFFNIWHNNSVRYVELLEVYDRWGNLVYQGIDRRIEGKGGLLTTNDYGSGWDGRFRGRYVNPGIFTWRAMVRFIDDEVLQFAGDLTVIDSEE